MMAVVLAFILSTTQGLYTYQSDHAVFLKDKPTYLICLVGQVPDAFICPEPTVKSPIPPKPLAMRQMAPFWEEHIRAEAVEKPAPQQELKREIVFFGFDSYRIKCSEKVKLDRLKLDRKGSYKIVGYTCDIGSKEYNDWLSLKRAEAVRDYLGVEAVVVGKGECCYLDPKVRSKNRRVEVEIRR